MMLHSYIQSLPKAELHVHLEGSIQPETLLELARRNRIDLPADDVAGLREWFNFRDFNQFVQVYLTITRCLKTRGDYELAVFEFGREMLRQNIRYAEVTFTPGTHQMMGVPLEVCMEGLSRGRKLAREEFGVEIQWIFDIARSAPGVEQLAETTLRLALEGMSEGVVALGLAGKEEGFPPEPFARWFERARAAGLHSCPHAGEGTGPESIRGAIRALHAERIGHGVRAIEDPALIEELIEKKIALDVCPTSNVRLGYYDSYAAHPLRRLYEAGLTLTINSDDPPLFGTTLTREVETLDGHFGLSMKAVKEIILNGTRCSFMPEERKNAMIVEAASRFLGKDES